MTQKRVSEMTDAEVQELAGARPATYLAASRSGRTWLDARDRYDELTQRDLSARAGPPSWRGASTTRPSTEAPTPNR